MLPGPDLINALSSKFEHVWLASEGREIMITCPHCHKRGMKKDGSGHLALNLAKNVGHCVKCDWGTRDVRRWLANYKLTINMPMSARSMMALVKKPTIVDTPSFQELKLPRDCRRMLPVEANMFGDSLAGKHLVAEDWMGVDAHACSGGFLAGYVIFPFYEEGDLVYWQARAADPEIPQHRRKWNPDDVEMGKSYWLYGFDYDLPKGGELYLTEGTLDKISAARFVKEECSEEDSVFSLQGTALSFPSEEKHPLNSQFGKIAFLKPTKVWVMFDPDAYVKAKGVAAALQLCGLDAEAVRLSLQEGDPNDAGTRGLSAAMRRTKGNWTTSFSEELSALKPA